MARHGRHKLRPLKVRTKEKQGRITTKGRRSLKKSQFGLPDGNRPGIKGRFPIDTIERARNALARAAQGVKRGTLSPAQAAQVRRRVHAKYPSIGKRKKKR